MQTLMILLRIAERLVVEVTCRLLRDLPSPCADKKPRSTWDIGVSMHILKCSELFSFETKNINDEVTWPGRSHYRSHCQAVHSSSTSKALFRNNSQKGSSHISEVKNIHLAPLLPLLRLMTSSSTRCRSSGSADLLHGSLLHFHDRQVCSSLRRVYFAFVNLREVKKGTCTSATASSVVLKLAASDWRCCKIVKALCVFSTIPRMQFNITWANLLSQTGTKKFDF